MTFVEKVASRRMSLSHGKSIPQHSPYSYSAFVTTTERSLPFSPVFRFTDISHSLVFTLDMSKKSHRLLHLQKQRLIEWTMNRNWCARMNWQWNIIWNSVSLSSFRIWYFWQIAKLFLPIYATTFKWVCFNVLPVLCHRSNWHWPCLI